MHVCVGYSVCMYITCTTHIITIILHCIKLIIILLLFLFHTSINSSKWLSGRLPGDSKAIFIKLERLLSFKLLNKLHLRKASFYWSCRDRDWETYHTYFFKLAMEKKVLNMSLEASSFAFKGCSSICLTQFTECTVTINNIFQPSKVFFLPFLLLPAAATSCCC